MRSSSRVRGLVLLLAPVWLTVSCVNDDVPQMSTSTSVDTGDPSTSTGTPPDTTVADDTSDGTAPDDSTGSESCVDPLDAACPTSPGIISTNQLGALLGHGDLVVVDTRAEAEFFVTHVPGAVRLDPSALRATVDGVQGQVASEADSRAVFEAAGLTPEVAVVIYGPNNGTEPARVLWTLAYYGHQGPLWMLDGGFDQWISEGRSAETKGTPPVASTYATVVIDALRVDEQWVLDHLEDPAVTLVDARSGGEYDGGHIPGALSVDWTRNLGGDGLFLSPTELLALYEEPPAGQTLVSYCQTGSRAAVDWLALAWLGYADVRLYDGSWAEWSADPGNPVEP